jgi:hypothetical protein
MKKLFSVIAGIILLACTISSSRADLAIIDGGFGQAKIDTTAPALSFLCLRTPDGTLDAKSLLSPMEIPWIGHTSKSYTQAYTYVVDVAGNRYESRVCPAQGVRQEKSGQDLITTVNGIKLALHGTADPVAVENWTLTASGSDLIWGVERTWLQDFDARITGTPALFFTCRPYYQPATSVVENSVVSAYWYDPDYTKGWYEPQYRTDPINQDYMAKTELDNSQLIDVPNTWSIFKLFTNWDNKEDLKLAVEGGYLYRRGFIAYVGEAGAVSQDTSIQHFHKGQVERVTLRISGVDKTSVGYQLSVTVPDKHLTSTLNSFYGSLLNCGAINDQLNYDFGNESDGWYCNSSGAQGYALLAGVPAAGKLSERPYDVAAAFRDHISHILGTMSPDGRIRYGYMCGGECADDQPVVIIGAWTYLIHSGDVAFIRRNLPDMEKLLNYFIQHRNSRGLFDLGPVHTGDLWYYDNMFTSGVTSEHNSMFYLALNCMADMQKAAGNTAKAQSYLDIAAQVKKAFNEYLWDEDAPGGPRFCDWITDSGRKVTFACDMCQFPPLAFGIATPEHAQKTLATLDKRIKELHDEVGYPHCAPLSAYWPIPDDLNSMKFARWDYMNGGSFLMMSYFEIMARANNGDPDGAYGMLSRFADATVAQPSPVFGDNWVTVKGERPAVRHDYEPYLADEVMVPAALVQGILGIRPTWDKLEVTPHLPSGWKSAEAEVFYKGRKYRISINGNRVDVKPLEETITPRPQVWEVRGSLGPDWELSVARPFAVDASPSAVDTIDANGGSYVSLKRVKGVPIGLWRLDETQDPITDVGPYHYEARIDGNGVVRGTSGHAPGTRAYSFGDRGWIYVRYSDRFVFGPANSFTIQAWVKTRGMNSSTIISRPTNYNLGIDGGKLIAWFALSDNQYKKVVGIRPVSDGNWHQVAAVFDALTQKLSTYVDGRLEASDDKPYSSKGVSIPWVGAPWDPSVLYIGSYGPGADPFHGDLSDISVTDRALSPEDMDRHVVGKCPFVSRGAYQSELCDWHTRVTITGLRILAELNGGRVDAVLEVSNDGFNTVAESAKFDLKDGVASYPVAGSIKRTYRYARVRFNLTGGNGGATSPMVRSFKLEGNP